MPSNMLNAHPEAEYYVKAVQGDIGEPLKEGTADIDEANSAEKREKPGLDATMQTVGSSEVLRYSEEMKKMVQEYLRLTARLQHCAQRQEAFLRSMPLTKIAADDGLHPTIEVCSEVTAKRTTNNTNGSGNTVPARRTTLMSAESAVTEIAIIPEEELKEQPGERKKKEKRFSDSSDQHLRLRATRMQAEMDALMGSLEFEDIDDSCRGRIRHVIESPQFESVMGLVILANSLFIGVEVEYVVRARAQLTPPYLYVLSHMFNIVFILELAIRLFATCGHSFFSDLNKWWNLLDLVVAFCSLLETLVDSYRLRDSYGSAYLLNVSNLRIIRVLRVVRLARVLRVSRLLRFFRALKALVHSITHTLRSLVWAMVLLSVIIFCFGIIFTQTAADYLAEVEHNPGTLRDNGGNEDKVQRWWGSLFTAMWTLFQSISGGVSWHEPIMALEFVDLSFISYGLFGVYICFTYFAVLNVVTGVFCQAAFESAARDNEQMISKMMANRKLYIEHISNLFSTIDQDGSGHITIAEFENRFQEEEVQAYFSSLELDPHDAWEFFKLLDVDKGGYLDVEEFVDGCLRVRGPAKSFDMLRMMHEQRRIIDVLTKLSAQLNPSCEDSASLVDQVLHGVKVGIVSPQNSDLC